LKLNNSETGIFKVLAMQKSVETVGFILGLTEKPYNS